MRTRSNITLAAAVLLVLAGCGGDDGAAGGLPVGGTLTIANAFPSVENTTVNLTQATGAANEARAADSFSPQPYCAISFTGAPGANNHAYEVQVYFRQSDQAVLHASVKGSANALLPPSYIVFSNDAGNPIAGVTVDLAARTVRFTDKVLTGGLRDTGTLNGTARFEANSTNVAACGT